MVKNNESREIVSFSRELMSFDLADVSVEELDRRLELAIANILPQWNTIGGCSTNCSTYCVLTCGTNCGLNTGCQEYRVPLQQ